MIYVSEEYRVVQRSFKMKMSSVFASTRQELDAAASRLGIHSKFRRREAGLDYYEVVQYLKLELIKNGAIELPIYRIQQFLEEGNTWRTKAIGRGRKRTQQNCSQVKRTDARE
jgi:hypothetical protein